MIQRVTSLEDPRLAEYARIGDPVWLRARGLFVAEGRLVVRRLIEDARFAVVSALVTPAALASLGDLFHAAGGGATAFVCEQAQMNALTGFTFHRGCLALARRPEPRGLEALPGGRVLVGLEGVGNPDNVGGIFRSALALGAAGVVLDARCGDPLYRKAVRTSMAATLRVPFVEVDEWTTAAAALRDAGFTIVALTPAADAMDIEAAGEALRGRRVVLLFGSEGSGLRADTLGAADARVRIPVDPRSDSLNVTVAAGIALHAFRGPAA